MEQPLTHDSAGGAASRIRKIELPWLILVALLLSTLLAAFQSSRQLRADTETRFTEIAQVEKRSLVRRLSDVENLLYSARAFEKVQPNPSQSAWNTYVSADLREGAPYPGVIAIQLVTDATLSRSVAPVSGSPASSLPTENMPLWGKSAGVLEVLNLAALKKTLLLSGPLQAPVGVPSCMNCVAMVLPLSVVVAPQQRSTATSQSKAAVLAVLDLAAAVSEMAADSAYPVVHELFDGDTRLYPVGDAATATVDKAEMRAEIPVEFGQRTLRLKISSTPQLEKALRSDMPRAILVIGIFGTILLGALVLLLTRLRAQAESLAASMTRKLQDQTRFTEDLIEFNPNPIFRKDAAGKFVAVNEAWEQLSGRNRADILGKTSHELDPTTENIPDELHDAQFLASETGYQASEAFMMRTDGRQFETIIAKKILRRADGSVDGMIGTITDVTLIKQLERELARQREQLDLVIRSSQQGIWDIDLSEGGASYFSARFREILGYTDVDFPANFEWRNHIHPDDAAEVRRRVIAHFKGDTSLFDIEPRIKRRDGNYMWVRVRAIAQRDANYRAIRFVGSIADVTDRKMAEVELTEANIRVTEAARAKESFLATMSHEIRTPLNGVLGMASLLSDTTLNDEQRDYIRLIRASGDTLLRLIDDVLDFSKIESGRMTLESVAVETVLVVEEALELVADKAREKGLALLFDMHEDVPFYILGDATRLRQILLNLLSNAIKFTAKGEIKLELNTHKRADGQLELEGRVTDTGIGIPAERASKLFQPFTQVDASTTRKYGGTGLGLAIVRRLSQLMGGDVRVESTDGQGSTFIFTVATSAALGPQKPYMQRGVADFIGKRLLVVEHNANRRQIQYRRCTWWGFDTVTATPEDAVRVLNAGPDFDVLLTEMTMSSPELLALQGAIEKDDRDRLQSGKSLISVILQSGVSRSELSQRQQTVIPRHDAFIMRPAGRGRLFDVLTRVVLHQPNLDVATRPYAPPTAFDSPHQTPVQGSSTSTSRTSAAQPEISRRSLSFIKIAGRTPKILVAEDNEVNQQVVLGMLRNLGCESDLAIDGSSAVEKARVGDYDIIFMDIHMPELDGVTAMQNIRAAGGICPPIVAMTAHALPGDREYYLSLGMNDYISKPIRTGDIKGLFERLFPPDIADQPTSPEQTMKRPSSAISAFAASRTEVLPILDTEQLEDLRYLPAPAGAGAGEEDAVGGLIKLFQTTASERMDEMERLLTGGHWARLAEIAHSLCGSSASMGYPRVAADCKDLELAARRKHTDQQAESPSQETLDDYFALIKFHYWEADTALQHWLAKSELIKS
ncbi:MAG: PAS domain S-box protein [Burkholderiales bacterium]|nr:PAS domain S-box protein [Burkholderiales bacterium]